jgi:signal transduction histidine kinase
VGIPADDVPRVFDKFYRGRAVRAGGSGLGLAIVKRVVHEHNGGVEIASVVGEGTTLRLVLPLDSAHG